MQNVCVDSWYEITNIFPSTIDTITISGPSGIFIFKGMVPPKIIREEYNEYDLEYYYTEGVLDDGFICYVPCEAVDIYKAAWPDAEIQCESPNDESQTAIGNFTQRINITILDNQILVNGEAPKFVTNVLGQKIANQNLRPGVYFVVVEGICQSVRIN